HVVTITEQGVEKVVFSDYPGVDVGQSRAATQSHTSAAGLVPNTWNPPDHTCGGAPTFSGTGNTELHDGTDLFGHPTFGKGGDEEPKEKSCDDSPWGCPEQKTRIVDYDWEKTGPSFKDPGTTDSGVTPDFGGTGAPETGPSQMQTPETGTSNGPPGPPEPSDPETDKDPPPP